MFADSSTPSAMLPDRLCSAEYKARDWFPGLNACAGQHCNLQARLVTAGCRNPLCSVQLSLWLPWCRWLGTAKSYSALQKRTHSSAGSHPSYLHIIHNRLRMLPYQAHPAYAQSPHFRLGAHSLNLPWLSTTALPKLVEHASAQRHRRPGSCRPYPTQQRASAWHCAPSQKGCLR